MQKKESPRPWLEAARKVMYKATLKEAKHRFGTRTPLFNYRWEHVTAVHTLAMRLARLVGADLEVVEAAAWLHDVAKEAGREHPALGAAYARDFLPTTDFPSEKIEAVAQVIEEHMGLWRDEPLERLESQVLWDADKLSKLGLTAAFHWLGMDFAAGEPVTTGDLVAGGRQPGWQDKTVASMHTQAARRAAESRLAAFRALWDDLEAELAGDDLHEGNGA
ncbi:MAG: HD domain-containing protein [Anaerolineae bacterium]|nr:HD domain-containing protein [Anaerolineae bacterium]